MRKPSARTQPDTANEILDLAQDLIQTRGYSAFSYQDIADVLQIRKASIHYHFPSKTSLGIAVVDRYTAQFSNALDAIAADSRCKSIDMLDRYIAPYLEFARTPDKVCLCGALAGEIMALPADLRTRVDGFFKEHQTWLTKILQQGAERGEFSLPDKPAKVARVFFGALQGALLVKRTTGDASQLKDVISVLKSQLRVSRRSI
jgi:TetR/AcrR family transcriptional regulator, transcriptional repressor for nem operon